MTDEAPAEEIENGEEKTSGRRLTEADYAKIRELYELGLKGVTELSDEFDISRQTLSRRFKEDGVKRGSRAQELTAAVKSGATAAAAASGAAAASAPGVIRYEDKREEWIEETRVQGYMALKQADMLARKTVADTLKSGAHMSSADADLKAIQRFQKILTDNLASRMELLDAKEFQGEENLPALVIEDLTEEDILAHHKMNGVLDESATIEDLLGEVGDIDIEATA